VHSPLRPATASGAVGSLERYVRELLRRDTLRRLVCAEPGGTPSEFQGRTDLGPILFLDRAKNPELPKGWTTVEANGQPYEVNFANVAANVARRPRETTNVLPDLLRGWFGASAGASGTARTSSPRRPTSAGASARAPALDARSHRDPPPALPRQRPPRALRRRGPRPPLGPGLHPGVELDLRVTNFVHGPAVVTNTTYLR
jgi:hypothetical protein